jgi:hypothetical protein
MVRGGSVAFGFFGGKPFACMRLHWGFAAFGAQSAHHRRFFPSDGSPRLAAFRPHPSHLCSLMFTAPACSFAQPAHHRGGFPSAGTPKVGKFS